MVEIPGRILDGIQHALFFPCTFLNCNNLYFLKVEAQIVEKGLKVINKTIQEIFIVQEPLSSSSNMADLKKIKFITSKVSKVNVEAAHLQKLKINKTVHEVIEKALKHKRKTLDKELCRIKLKGKKSKSGKRRKEQGKPQKTAPAIKLHIK